MTTNRQLRYQAASVYVLAAAVLSAALIVGWTWP